MAIRPNQLEKEITRELKRYSTEVTKGIERIKDDVAKEGLQMLKAGGPYKDRSGKYKKGWSIKKTNSDRTLWNRTNYQITHLLEYGHALKRGGRKEPDKQRTVGSVKARPHIAPVEQYVITEYEKRVRDFLK